MKRYASIFTIFLGCACGDPGVFQENHAQQGNATILATVRYMEQAYGTRPSSSERVLGAASIWTGPKSAVEAVCGSQALCCNINHRFVISDEANYCQCVSHETGHSIAVVEAVADGGRDDPWDASHKRYGDLEGKEWVYSFPFHLCP